MMRLNNELFIEKKKKIQSLILNNIILINCDRENNFYCIKNLKYMNIIQDIN